MSKRRHNFGTKRFKEKSLFIFHARIALKSLILLFVRLIARGARIGKTHTDRHTDTQTHRQNKYCNPRACAPRVKYELDLLALSYTYTVSCWQTHAHQYISMRLLHLNLFLIQMYMIIIAMLR